MTFNEALAPGAPLPPPVASGSVPFPRPNPAPQLPMLRAEQLEDSESSCGSAEAAVWPRVFPGL